MQLTTLIINVRDSKLLGHAYSDKGLKIWQDFRNKSRLRKKPHKLDAFNYFFETKKIKRGN